MSCAGRSKRSPPHRRVVPRPSPIPPPSRLRWRLSASNSSSSRSSSPTHPARQSRWVRTCGSRSPRSRRQSRRSTSTSFWPRRKSARHAAASRSAWSSSPSIRSSTPARRRGVRYMRWRSGWRRSSVTGLEVTSEDRGERLGAGADRVGGASRCDRSLDHGRAIADARGRADDRRAGRTARANGGRARVGGRSAPSLTRRPSSPPSRLAWARACRRSRSGRLGCVRGRCTVRRRPLGERRRADRPDRADRARPRRGARGAGPHGGIVGDRARLVAGSRRRARCARDLDGGAWRRGDGACAAHAGGAVGGARA